MRGQWLTRLQAAPGSAPTLRNLPVSSARQKGLQELHRILLFADGIVLRIIAQLSSTQAQLSGQRVCRRWRALVRELRSCGGLATRVIVTCSGENKVAVIDPTLPSDRSVIQRFTPLPPRQKRPRHPGCPGLGPQGIGGSATTPEKSRRQPSHSSGRALPSSPGK